MKEIHISRDFSKHPVGRYRRDGKFSGQRFREEYLEDAIRAGEDVIVILDGARSYGSSFLDEAFGGLIRDSGLSLLEVRKHLKIIANEKLYETYKRRAYSFIEDAAKNKPWNK